MATTYKYDKFITIPGVTYDGRHFYATLELVSQDYVNNCSYVKFTIIAEGGNAQYYDIPEDCAFYLYDSVYGSRSSAFSYWYYYDYRGATYFPHCVGTATQPPLGGRPEVFEVPHRADGTMTLAIDWAFSLAKWSGGGVGTTVAGSIDYWELPSLRHDVSLDFVPNFTDEESPEVEYTISPTDGLANIKLSLLTEDENTVLAERTIDPANTKYTLQLTAAERQKIYNYSPNSNTCIVKFKLSCNVPSGPAYSSMLTKTLTIVNANPVVNATVTKTSDDEGSLTGSADVLILYRSDVSYTMSATAQKGSTIKSIKAACGSKSFSTSTGAFTDVESGTFVFTAVDSRGNVGTYTVGLQYVDYTSLTCNLEIDAPRTDGTLDFTILGSYFPNDFGAVQNTLKVEYRYSVNEGEYTDWIEVTPTISGKSYYANVSLEGLDYQNMYRFQGRATDRLQIAESGAYAIKTRPVFDWSENDFNFNCPVTITDGYLKYPLMGVINAMTKTYVCDVTVFDGANYSVSAAGATICGNILRCNFTATRDTTSGSGNITNETVCTLSIAHGGKINNMLNVCFGNGSTGHVATFLTSNASYTAETLDFDVVLSATAGATNEFSTYFQVPISINLDKFV